MKRRRKSGVMEERKREAGKETWRVPGARKPETKQASEPASQTSQPAEPEKGERTTPMMNHPPGVSKSKGERRAIRGRATQKRLHVGTR